MTKGHFSGPQRGTEQKWKWRALPTGPLNGMGYYDLHCEYGGTDFTVVGSDVFCVYRGEFWRSAGQANQIFQFKTDGTFVRQFGTPHAPTQLRNAPGAALNAFVVAPVTYGGHIYLYTNDETGRGVHRWKIPVTQ